jgi:hypothetical protein
VAITTYAELQAAVLNWVDDASIAAERVREFIRLAEAEINLRLAARPIPPVETRQTATVTGEFLAVPTLPAPFVKVRSFEISYVVQGETIRRRLRHVTPDAMALIAERGDGDEILWQTSASEQPPLYYAHYDSEFRFFPPPPDGQSTYSTTYSAQIVAETRLPLLSDTSTTNWLLTAFPNVYLYGTLAQAEVFGWNDSRAAGFDAKFAESMTAVLASYPRPASDVQLRTDVPVGWDRRWC